MEAERIFPDNWKEIVQGKKVIFYNTSVSGMLAGREKHIEKMKWVFKTFQKHPEVVLWWRPHPLELSTLQSLNPGLEEQYRKMHREYQEEMIGILDESADLHRAIAISDAYYGDWSSITSLYRAVKKPVLYENDNIFDWNKGLFFDITDFVIIDRNVWFLSSTINILFAMNLDTFELVETIVIPYGNMSEKYMSCYITTVGDYLVLIPGCGKWIIRFDLNKKSFNKLEIGNYSECTKFSSYSIYNGCIYMLPASESRVLKYDVAQNKIICEKNLGEQNNGLFLGTNIEITGSYIYAVETGGNHIYKYDMQNDTYEEIQVSGEDIQLFGIKKVKDLFMLILANKNKILLWDEKENRTWKLEGIPKGYPEKLRPFCDVVECKGDIYFFPEQSDKVLKLNTEQIIFEPYLGIEEKKEGGDEAYFTRAKNIGDRILAFDYWSNQWMVVNPEEHTVNKRNIIAQNEMLDRIAGYSVVAMGEIFDKQERFYAEEKGFYTLHNYIKYVSHRNPNEQKRRRESVGEKIYVEIAADIAMG